MPPLIWTSKLKCRRKTHNIYTLDRMVVDGESYLRIIYSHLLIAFIVHIIRKVGKSIDFQWCDGFGQLKDPFSFIHLTEQSNATVTNVCINVIDMTVVKIRLHCIAFFSRWFLITLRYDVTRRWWHFLRWKVNICELNVSHPTTHNNPLSFHPEARVGRHMVDICNWKGISTNVNDMTLKMALFMRDHETTTTELQTHSKR